MRELRPDPLDRPRKDDFPFVVTGCLGLFLTPFGGYLLWGVLSGDTFRGKIGRTIGYSEMVWRTGAITFAGLALLAVTVWGLRRIRRRD